ncbi:MAG: ATP-binding protein [Bacteroidota bacterium]
MVFLTLVISSAVYGQTENLDQPYPDYPSIKETKTAFNKYLGRNYDSAIVFAQNKYQFAKAKNWGIGMASFSLLVAKAYGNKGKRDSSRFYLNVSKKITDDLIYDDPEYSDWLKGIKASQEQSFTVNLIRDGDYDSALIHAKKTLALYQEIEHNDGIASINNILGVISYNTGHVNDAAKYYTESYKLYRELNRLETAIVILGNLGFMYKTQGDLPKAMDAFLEQLQLGKEMDKVLAVGTALAGIAAVYYVQGDYEQTIKKSHESIVIFKKIDQYRNLILSQVVLGDALAKLSKTDSAFYYYDEALFLVDEHNIISEKGYVLERIGTLKKDLGQYKEALKYINEGIDVAKKMNFYNDYWLLLLAKTETLFELNRIEEAKVTTDEALKIAADSDDMGFKRDTYRIANKVYQRLGLYEKAYDLLSLYHVSKDSLFDQEKASEIAQIELNYAVENERKEAAAEQEKQDLAYQEQIRREQLIQYGVVGIAVIITIMLLFIYRSYRSKAKINDQLEVSNDKLQQLDQFKTRLFANINHDLRTPLTLIQGYASKVSSNENNYLTTDSENDLRHLNRNAATLTEMTNEIQDLLLLEESKLRLTFNKVLVHQYMSTLVKMFSSIADLSDITLRFTSNVDEGLIAHLDQKHFSKIMYNILSNAFRYTEEGGKVMVSVTDGTDEFTVSIADTGKGINENDLPHIFDRFYQSPLNEYRSREGFGIGLAVVKELMSLHNGEITVESEPGKGTEFQLVFPLNLDKEAIDAEVEAISLEELPMKAAKGSMISTSDTKHKTVLIVDDHHEIRKYISGIIAEDYGVKEAADGQQALELLEKNHIDLIITDLMMPWLDGFELIEKLQESEASRDIPVMVVSARTTEEDKHKILDAGVNEFISKPFDPVILKKRLQNMIKDQNKNSNKWDEVKSDQVTLSQIEQNVLKKLNQIILENIGNPDLNTELIAEALSASTSKAVRLTKKLTGQSPAAYIKDIRMNYINDMINQRKIKNATEAATAIGMKHATYFSKQYESHFGKMPEYAKQE